MTDWQPIETAPRDGTEILIFEPASAAKIHVVSWQESEDYKVWCYAEEVLSDICPEGAEPTHWMPLPQPPAPFTRR